MWFELPTTSRIWDRNRAFASSLEPWRKAMTISLITSRMIRLASAIIASVPASRVANSVMQPKMFGTSSDRSISVFYILSPLVHSAISVWSDKPAHPSLWRLVTAAIITSMLTHSCSCICFEALDLALFLQQEHQGSTDSKAIYALAEHFNVLRLFHVVDGFSASFSCMVIFAIV